MSRQLHAFCAVVTFVLGLAFFTSESWAEGLSAPRPVVYSGAVHNDRTDQDIRMRLFFLQQPKIGQAIPVTAVLGMLYFGAEGTHEYVSLYYDPIIVHQANREILLFRDDDARSRRLPTIRLRLNEDNSEMVGTMVSTSESVVGKVSLRSGWDFGSGNFISEVAGIFDASNCERLDGAAMHFEELELIPSRLHQEKIVPEGMFGETNFIGNGLCRRLGHVNCVSFSSGSYNFVKGRLDLHQGLWDWVCQRSGANEIDCSSNVMKECKLKKVSPVLAPYLLPMRQIPVERFSWQNVIASNGSQDCARWEGDFRGILTHRLAERQQFVDIRLNSFHSGSAEGVNRCIVTGSAKLYFAIQGTKSSVLNFPIINTEMNASNQSMIFHSDAYSDLALQVTVDPDGVMSGNWYSRLFGLVGDFSARRGVSEFGAIEFNRQVFSYEGIFTNIEHPLYQLDLKAIEAGFDKSSHDPFVQLKIQGNLFFGGGLPDLGGVTAWDSFASSSYDYFTDLFVMRGNATYSGYIDQGGMHLRASSNKYLSVVTHDLEKVLEYRRK